MIYLPFIFMIGFITNFICISMGKPPLAFGRGGFWYVRGYDRLFQENRTEVQGSFSDQYM